MNYPHVWRALCEYPWALSPVKMLAMMEILEVRLAGGRWSAEEIRARLEAADQGSTRQGAPARGSVAVIPLVGLMSQRASLVNEMSGGGGASTEQFAARFRQALADPGIGSVVIDVSSPGGSVFGVGELADEIFRARDGAKPVVAVANSEAASAAYWVASAAGELVVTPGGEVGSIGVYGMHMDESGALESLGLRPTLISAGKFKVEGNPYEPLAEEARGAFQARVDEYYRMFISAVARHRGVSAEQVQNGFGEGRMVGARQAVRLGMADRVETLDNTVARLAKGGYRAPRRAGERAAEELRVADVLAEDAVERLRADWDAAHGGLADAQQAFVLDEGEQSAAGNPPVDWGIVESDGTAEHSARTDLELRRRRLRLHEAAAAR